MQSKLEYRMVKKCVKIFQVFKVNGNKEYVYQSLILLGENGGQLQNDRLIKIKKKKEQRWINGKI